MPQNVAGPGARLAVRIGPADAGRRVSVRRRLPGRGGQLGDVVGILEAWSGGREGVLTIRRRDDSRERVDAVDLVAAKVVPPEVSAFELQRIAQQGWPARVSATLGDWELRWTGGVSGRANSVRVGGDPGRPLPAALREVSAWYAARGGEAQLQIPLPSQWDADLERLGWHEVRRTHLLTTSVRQLLTSSDRAGPGPTTLVHDEPSPEWLAALRDHDATTHEQLVAILTSPPVVGFAEARGPDGALLGIGRGTVTSAWLGVTSVEVAPTARRHGVASAVMHALAEWSAGHGAVNCFLQVFATNTPALALYDRLGMRTHHVYVYRRRVEASEPADR